jgi:hypothetical protein
MNHGILFKFPPILPQKPFQVSAVVGIPEYQETVLIDVSGAGSPIVLDIPPAYIQMAETVQPDFVDVVRRCGRRFRSA